MRWIITDQATGLTITRDNPTDKKGRARLMNTIKTHTAVGRGRKWK